MNRFIQKISERSDKELLEISQKRSLYQEEAYLAAIAELKKRNLASKELQQIQGELVTKGSRPDQHEQSQDEPMDHKKALQETLDLLVPTQNYYYTPILIYLNVLILVIMALSGINAMEPSVASLISWGGNLKNLTLNGENWRLLSNIFIHGGIFHLLFNMYAFLHIGGQLEYKFGNHRYLFVYLVTGIFASLASISMHENIVSVGASGAIFGTYGLFLSLLISKNFDIPKESRTNLTSSIIFFIGYNLFYGFIKEGIDNAAHIGGLVSGFIIGLAYYPALKAPKYSLPTSICIALVLSISVVLAPILIPNKIGEFQSIIEEFTKNEEKALWVYTTDLSSVPTNRIEDYQDRIQTEGIDLWERNLELLAQLEDLPPYLEDRVELLTKYCELRKESYNIIQILLIDENPTDRFRLTEINTRIEQIINKLTEMNLG